MVRDGTTKKAIFKKVSFVSLQRKLLGELLPIDWASEMATFFKRFHIN